MLTCMLCLPASELMLGLERPLYSSPMLSPLLSEESSVSLSLSGKQLTSVAPAREAICFSYLYVLSFFHSFLVYLLVAAISESRWPFFCPQTYLSLNILSYIAFAAFFHAKVNLTLLAWV